MADRQTNINLDYWSAQKATADFYKSQYFSNRKPVNVDSEGNDDFRIRVGIIDNYMIERNGKIEDPLNIDRVINMKNGKVAIRWLSYNGGMLRSDSYGYPSAGYPQDWKYIPSKDSKYPEKRTLDCYNHDKASDREILDLSHAFIWANEDNWCGINSLPPVGTKVAIGFLKNNQPVILSCIQTNYKVCKPYLKPGETLIKGYGNNYVHFRQSNKIDIHADSIKGKIDIDDPRKKDTYPNTIDMWMRFDCYTRNLLLDVNQKDTNALYRSTMELKPEMTKITVKNDKTESFGTFTPNEILLKSNDGKLYVGDETILQNGNAKLKLTNNLTDINVDMNLRKKLSIPRYSDVSSTLTSILKRINALESRMASTENRITRLEFRLSTAERNVNSLKNKTSSLENRTRAIESRCSSLERRTTSMQNNIVSLSNNLSNLRSTVNQLYGTINSINYTVNYNSNRITWLEMRI